MRSLDVGFVSPVKLLNSCSGGDCVEHSLKRKEKTDLAEKVKTTDDNDGLRQTTTDEKTTTGDDGRQKTDEARHPRGSVKKGRNPTSLKVQFQERERVFSIPST